MASSPRVRAPSPWVCGSAAWHRTERVAVMLPTGPDFFSCLFGILYAGGVPVPIYPPMRRSQVEEHLRRQARILGNAEACFLITGAEAQPIAALLRSQVMSLQAVVTVAELAVPTAVKLPHLTSASATALIQYTSGSTGDPKGVVLSHENLLSNIRAMGEQMEASSSDVFVSWAAALSRYGSDRRLARMSLLCGADGDHVANKLPCPTGAMALGHSPPSRHAVRRTELRVRALSEQDQRLEYQGTRSQFPALCGQRC